MSTTVYTQPDVTALVTGGECEHEALMSESGLGQSSLQSNGQCNRRGQGTLSGAVHFWLGNGERHCFLGHGHPPPPSRACAHSRGNVCHSHSFWRSRSVDRFTHSTGLTRRHCFDCSAAVVALALKVESGKLCGDFPMQRISSLCSWHLIPTSGVIRCVCVPFLANLPDHIPELGFGNAGYSTCRHSSPSRP